MNSATPTSPDGARRSSDGRSSTEEGAQDRHWAQFQHARAGLAEVMNDDELRDLGFDLEVLDSRP